MFEESSSGYLLESNNALNLFQKEQENGHIVTFCQELDKLLGGGVALGKITEFFGVPGIGKTQICLQLAVDTHISEQHGGLGGDVIFIDTEGGFMIDRVVDIANATIKHCKCLAPDNIKPDSDELPAKKIEQEELSLDTILSGIHYFRCLDDIEVMSVVHKLANFLNQHKSIKLLIIDSIAAPFRYTDDISIRTQVLSSLAQNLNQLASRHNLAVVLTNQMTTRVKAGGVSYHVPALGEAWGHACSTRVLLHWQGNVRCAQLVKCLENHDLSCQYRITAAGVRDLSSQKLSISESSKQSDCSTVVTPHVQNCDFDDSHYKDQKDVIKQPPAKKKKIS